MYFSDWLLLQETAFQKEWEKISQNYASRRHEQDARLCEPDAHNRAERYLASVDSASAVRRCLTRIICALPALCVLEDSTLSKLACLARATLPGHGAPCNSREIPFVPDVKSDPRALTDTTVRSFGYHITRDYLSQSEVSNLVRPPMENEYSINKPSIAAIFSSSPTSTTLFSSRSFHNIAKHNDVHENHLRTFSCCVCPCRPSGPAIYRPL